MLSSVRNCFAAALLLPVVAAADIVFFDFNDAPQEIEAVRRAAKARGQNVHVFPGPKTDDQRANQARLAELQTRMRELETQFRSTREPSDRSRLQREFRAAQSERNQLARGIRFGAHNVGQILKDLQAKGVKVSSLVLSGHDGNGDFSGTQGSLHSEDLRRALKEVPQLASGIKSLFLAGCYTATPGSLEFEWQGTLPNLRAVAGYPGSAPDKTRGAGHQFLTRFLSGEERLARARTPAEVKGIVNGMIPGDVAPTAAICLPGKKYVTKNEYQDLEKLWGQCESILDTLDKNKNVYECYLYAQPGCENPPNETQSGPLREYYRALQQVQPCRHAPHLAHRTQHLHDGETMIRLIYWKNITKNFAEENKESLEQTKRMLLAAGVPEELADKVTKIKDMTRKDALDMIRQLNEYRDTNQVNDRDMAEGDPERASALMAMRGVGQTLSDHLGSLAPNCIPFHWVEGNSNARSNCDVDRYLGERAWDVARADVPIHRLQARISRLEQEFQRGDRQRERGTGADPVVSDDAVAATAARGQSEQYRARLEALHGEMRVLNYERDIRRMEGDPRYARDLPAYRRELENVRAEHARAEARARDLGDPVDLRALRENRAEFFATALRAAGADSARHQQTVQIYERELQRIRERLEGASEQDRRWLTEDVRGYERQIARLRTQETQRQQHREYIEQMNRVLSTPGGDPAAQERISQIVTERVHAQRRQSMENLSQQIALSQREVDYCSAESAPDWCRTELPRFRERLQNWTQELTRMQTHDDLTY